MHPFRTFHWLLGVLAIATSARAQGSEYATAQIQQTSLDGTDCASVGSLIAAVEQRLRRRVFVAEPEGDLRVTVAFGRNASEWSADIDLLTLQGQHLGHRRISSQARECSGIENPLALVVALMVDLTRDDVRTRAAPLPAAETTEVRVPGQSEAADGWTAVLSLSGVSILGQLPELGWGTRLATELRPKAAWSVELGIAAFLPATINDGTSSQAKFTLYQAEIGICGFLVRQLESELLLCAGPQVGLERASGTGYALNRATQTTSVNPFIKAESTWWPTPQFGIRLGLGAAAPLIHDQFYATRADGSQAPLFKPAVMAPFLQAGVCLAL